MDEREPGALGEIGFAEFTAALITQTLDAVIAAQLQQEERVSKLQEAAGLTPAQFAEEAVSLDDAKDELSRLFPSTEYPKGVTPGAPYVPSGQGKTEEPPVLSRTGYTMKKGDWDKQSDGTVTITEQGYRNMLSLVRQVLAATRQAGILQMMRRGIPRVIVDHGRVNAKLFFQFQSAGKSGTSPLLPAKALPVLAVRSVEMRRPEVARLTVNLVGEVDITFKTISE